MAFEYDRYRYDHLSDAVDYARLQRSKPSATNAADPRPPPEPLEVPDESQRRSMAELAITFQDGIYRLGTFRYERLADAVDYARRKAPPR